MKDSVLSSSGPVRAAGRVGLARRREDGGRPDGRRDDDRVVRGAGRLEQERARVGAGGELDAVAGPRGLQGGVQLRRRGHGDDAQRLGAQAGRGGGRGRRGPVGGRRVAGGPDRPVAPPSSTIGASPVDVTADCPATGRGPRASAVAAWRGSGPGRARRRPPCGGCGGCDGPGRSPRERGWEGSLRCPSQEAVGTWGARGRGWWGRRVVRSESSYGRVVRFPGRRRGQHGRRGRERRRGGRRRSGVGSRVRRIHIRGKTDIWQPPVGWPGERSGDLTDVRPVAHRAAGPRGAAHRPGRAARHRPRARAPRPAAARAGRRVLRPPAAAHRLGGGRGAAQRAARLGILFASITLRLVSSPSSCTSPRRPSGSGASRSPSSAHASAAAAGRDESLGHRLKFAVVPMVVLYAAWNLVNWDLHAFLYAKYQLTTSQQAVTGATKVDFSNISFVGGAGRPTSRGPSAAGWSSCSSTGSPSGWTRGCSTASSSTSRSAGSSSAGWSSRPSSPRPRRSGRRARCPSGPADAAGAVSSLLAPLHVTLPDLLAAGWAALTAALHVVLVQVAWPLLWVAVVGLLVGFAQGDRDVTVGRGSAARTVRAAGGLLKPRPGACARSTTRRHDDVDAAALRPLPALTIAVLYAVLVLASAGCAGG